MHTEFDLDYGFVIDLHVRLLVALFGEKSTRYLSPQSIGLCAVAVALAE